jgi:heterodisulfide reductase subunit B
MNTKPDVGIRLVARILHAAQKADVIVTVCPMCQMNLEAHQNRIQQQSKDFHHVTIVYLPQLLGFAMGLPAESLRFDLNLKVTGTFRDQILGRRFAGKETRKGAG